MKKYLIAAVIGAIIGGIPMSLLNAPENIGAPLTIAGAVIGIVLMALWQKNYKNTRPIIKSIGEIKKESDGIEITCAIPEMCFSDDLHSIQVRIRNNTHQVCELVWDNTTVTFRDNSNKVIHEGVKLVNKNETMVNTTIPPSGSINDIIVPANLVSWNEGSDKKPGGWVYKPIFNGNLNIGSNDKLATSICMLVDGKKQFISFEWNVEVTNKKAMEGKTK